MSQLPQVGDQFGRYRIDGHIGQGGMGVVLSATDTGIDRRVALKVLSAALTGTEEFHHRFQREASVLARLSSPHVIDIFDYGIHDDCPYIATQYVGGGDLGALLQVRGAMPPQLAARVCSQVADALGDAHRVDVVHRDVKPSNVLLRDADTLDLHAYLCDFGIARADSEGLTVPGSVAGTWSYLSPECGRGEPATVASDVYAVGCLFWAALTGRAPYRGTDVEIAMAHQQQPVPQLEPVDDFAAHANAILARTMAKDPAERFADADQLRSALLAAAQTPTSGIRPVADPGAAAGAGGPGPRTPTPTPAGMAPGAAHPSGAYPPPPAAASAGTSGSGQHPPYGGFGAGHYAGGPPPAGSGASGSGRDKGGSKKVLLLVAAAALAVVVVVGGIVAVGALGGDDDGPGPTTGGGDGPTGAVTGDLDDDGLGDLQVTLQPQEGGEIVARDLWTLASEGDTFAAPERQDDPVDDYDSVRKRRDLGDMDGDGVNETLVTEQVLGPGDDPLTVSAEMSGGATIDDVELDHPGPAILSANYLADADGDGLDDVFTTTALDSEFSVQVRLSDGEGGLSEPVIDVSIPTAAKDPLDVDFSGDGALLEVGDYDGDGMADVILLENAETSGKNAILPEYEATLTLLRSTGTDLEPASTTQRVTTGGLSDIFFDTGDFDGDGDDEVLIVPAVTGNVLSLEVMDVDESGPQPNVAWGTFNPTSQTATLTGLGVSDVDGDGLDDVVNVDPARSEDNRTVAHTAISDGDSFAPPARWARWQATNKRFFRPQVTGAVYP